MVFALILILGSGPTTTAVRVGTYVDVAECNRRAAWLQSHPRVNDAFCLPADS